MSPRILFIPDAGPSIGGGHIMRSLTLAQAVAAAGAQALFLASPDAAAVLDAFAPGMAREAAASSEPDALAQAAGALAFDAVVFDHFRLARPEHEAIAQGRPTLVIDDLADRSLGADLVLDAGPERRTQDYEGLVKPEARLLLGPTYAPVRPQFAALRAQALARRSGPVRQVLVSLGLTDVGAVTGRVAERLLRRSEPFAIDVALGGAAPSLPLLRRLAATDERLSLHIDTTAMATLMAQADIAVGAGGVSTWERCTLGLPTVLMVLADNQRPGAEAVAARGAALVVGEEGLDAALNRLLTDAALRAQLSAASAELCDGLGAERAARALLELVR